MAGSIEQILSNQDYYEIRLESIGGLGANLCGKMVGELACDIWISTAQVFRVTVPRRRGLR